MALSKVGVYIRYYSGPEHGVVYTRYSGGPEQGCCLHKVFWWPRVKLLFT